ncbi:unnamed protein product [Dovyalis caffra]|uniref:H15 domain-containing protein n=1 Tax=Dovyalis caffra TaxID=77055 RepID=A0AAV1SHA4_9ROSI|nr:unnamed protein product [Dovyalis caffra]
MSRMLIDVPAAGEGCCTWKELDYSCRVMVSHGKIDTNFTNTTALENYNQYESNKRHRSGVILEELSTFILPQPVSAQTAMHIDEMLAGIHYYTPEHAPYSEMIHRAIDHALKEGKGSSQASISLYLKSQYHDLPWAHESFLSHHLALLATKGEITITPNGCYMFPPSSHYLKNQQQGRKEVKMPLTMQYSNIGEGNLSVKPAITTSIPLLAQADEPQVIRAVVEVKKRRGRPPNKEKMEAKEKEKQTKARRKQDCSNLGGGQEILVIKDKKVYYGPKKRRGRSPKSSNEATPATANGDSGGGRWDSDNEGKKGHE